MKKLANRHLFSIFMLAIVTVFYLSLLFMMAQLFVLTPQAILE